MTPAAETSFETLVEQHRKILYKVCRSYCRDAASREDLAQEILIQLWRSSASFDGRCRFSTWMYRIALNVAISFYRRESVRTRYVVTGEPLWDIADKSAPASGDVRRLYDFIETLDPLNRALILLYLDDHSYREIAAVLGISETNAATRVGRLKLRMKRELA